MHPTRFHPLLLPQERGHSSSHALSSHTQFLHLTGRSPKASVASLVLTLVLIRIRMETSIFYAYDNCKTCLVFTCQWERPPSWTPIERTEGLDGQGWLFLTDCPMHCRIASIPSKATAHTRHCDNPKTPHKLPEHPLGRATTAPFKSHHSRNPTEVARSEETDLLGCTSVIASSLHSVNIRVYACMGWVLGTQGRAKPDPVPAFVGHPCQGDNTGSREGLGYLHE